MRALYKIYAKTPRELRYVAVEGLAGLGEAEYYRQNLKHNNPTIHKIELAYLGDVPTYTREETEERNLIR